MIEELYLTLRSIYGTNYIGLHEPVFDADETKYTIDCIKSNYVSSVGSFVTEFEESLANYTKSDNALVTSNGTSALHIACKVNGVDYDTEVLMPSLTFVASANAVLYCGASPVFIDCEDSTFGLDPKVLREWLVLNTEMKDSSLYNIKTKKRISAIIAVHIFGHPCQIEELLLIAKEFSLPLIEDAAGALGSIYKNQYLGTFGDAGIVSFNGNKIITTGGGGAVFFKEPQKAEHARHIATTAKKKHVWLFEHDMLGYNYRMPNINASIGCAQMKKLDKFIENKRKLYLKYKNALKEFDFFEVHAESENSISNYWLQAIVLKNPDRALRDSFLEITNSNQIMTRPIWNPLHTLEHLKNYQSSDLSVTESIFNRVINIPSSASII